MTGEIYKIVWKGFQVGILYHSKTQNLYLEGTWSSFEDQIAQDFEELARSLDEEDVEKDFKKGVFIRLLALNSEKPIFGIIQSLDADNLIIAQIIENEGIIKELTAYFEPHTKFTEISPNLNFNSDSGVFNLTGDSYPENTIEFFEPLFDHLKKYTAQGGKKIILNFKMTFFNTGFSRRFLEILNLLEDYQFNKSVQVEVNWYYPKDDLEMLECGQEYAEDIKLKFNFIPY